jgi:hypothetical protein
MMSSVGVASRRLIALAIRLGEPRREWAAQPQTQASGRSKRKLCNEPSGQAVGYRDKRRWMFLLCDLSGRDGVAYLLKDSPT